MRLHLHLIYIPVLRNLTCGGSWLRWKEQVGSPYHARIPLFRCVVCAPVLFRQLQRFCSDDPRLLQPGETGRKLFTQFVYDRLVFRV